MQKTLAINQSIPKINPEHSKEPDVEFDHWRHLADDTKYERVLIVYDTSTETA